MYQQCTRYLVQESIRKKDILNTRVLMTTWSIYGDIFWTVQRRIRSGTVISAETVTCTTTSDGTNNPCGDRHLADAIIMFISDIHVTYVEGNAVKCKRK